MVSVSIFIQVFKLGWSQAGFLYRSTGLDGLGLDFYTFLRDRIVQAPFLHGLWARVVTGLIFKPVFRLKMKIFLRQKLKKKSC